MNMHLIEKNIIDIYMNIFKMVYMIIIDMNIFNMVYYH